MTYKSAVAMVRINGPKVRSLREQQELTQLYLATAVAVTTETISRWERASRPTIKKENGLKLAEALQVELADILAETESKVEKTVEKSAGESPLDARSSLPRWRIKILTGLTILGATIGLVFSIYFFLPAERNMELSAVRIMPVHTVAGQPFPVVIQVEITGKTTGSFLIQESLPPGCRIINSTPRAAVHNAQLLKWINKEGGSSLFAYLAVLTVEPGQNETVEFSGTVKLRQGGYGEVMILGNNTVQLRPYHWADRDRDNIISDDEILAVYDDFARVDKLPINIEQIEEMWLGEKYSWNQRKNIFEITGN